MRGQKETALLTAFAVAPSALTVLVVKLAQGVFPFAYAAQWTTGVLLGLVWAAAAGILYRRARRPAMIPPLATVAAGLVVASIWSADRTDLIDAGRCDIGTVIAVVSPVLIALLATSVVLLAFWLARKIVGGKQE